MTADEIVEQLKSLGTETYKKALRNHGIPEPFLGVKIEDLKKIQRRIKKDYQLALALYDTGIYDAMYLAGLIADDARMTKKDLRRWLDGATCGMLSEYTVPWVAAESNHGRELALEWIESGQETVAAAGWATLGSLVGIKDDADLDLAELKRLLQRVQKTIHRQPNRVRHVMNGFVIAVGSYVRDLTDFALQTAMKIGPVAANMGGAACKVPHAPDNIQSPETRGHREEAKDGEMLNEGRRLGCWEPTLTIRTPLPGNGLPTPPQRRSIWTGGSWSSLWACAPRRGRGRCEGLCCVRPAPRNPRCRNAHRAANPTRRRAGQRARRPAAAEPGRWKTVYARRRG